MNKTTKEKFRKLTKFYNVTDFKSEAALSTGPTDHQLRVDLIESLFFDKQNPGTSAEVYEILSEQEVDAPAPTLSFPPSAAERMALRLYEQAKKETSEPPPPPCVVYYKTPGQGDEKHPTLGERILYDKPLGDIMNPAIDIKPDADILMAKIDSDVTSPILRGVSILESYLNYIPNIERSRCVPYLKVNFITTDQESLVVLDFLGATKDRFGDKVDMNKFSADHLFTQGSKVDDKNFYGGGGTIQGMELFTMPQSLIAKQTPYSDPFRPLMSLNGADINIYGANNGFISFKKASLKLTLFDRTKLNDVSFLLDPSRFQETVIELSAGWTHPDPSSIYGAVINEMKVKDLYKIVKSDYSISKSASIDITLNLASLGGSDIIKKAAVGSDADVVSLKDYYKIISGLSKRYSKLARKVNSKEEGVANILPSIVIESKESKQAIPIDKKAVRAVHEKLTSFKESLDTAVEDDLDPILDAAQLKELSTVIKGLSDTEGGSIRSYETALDDQVKKFTSFIGAPPTAAVPPAPGAAPPTAATPPVDFFLLKDVDTSKYISFGKLFLNTVGMPMIAVDNGEVVGDVQILMYNFNKYAGEMGYNDGLNPDGEIINPKNSIISFALEKESLIQEMSDIIKKKYQLTAIDILRYVRKKMKSKYDPQFGIIDGSKGSDFKKNTDELKSLEATKKENTEKKDASDDADERARLGTSITDTQKLIDGVRLSIADLEQSGEDTIMAEMGTSKIKMPKLQLLIESNNIKRLNPETKKIDTKFQIRYHIYDENEKPYEYQEEAMSIQQTITVNAKEEGIVTTPGANFFNALNEAKVLEVITKTSEDKSTDTKYKIVGRSLSVKKAIKENMPSITYGTEATAINSVSINSISDKNIETHHLLEARQKKSASGGDKPLESEEKSITEFNAQKILPVTIDIDMMGCTVLEYGQQLFVDFSTNTDLDNIYGIIGITHSLKPGSFSTNVKLTPTFSGVDVTFKDMLDDLAAAHDRLAAIKSAD